jgi:hypothetical protein
MEKTMGKHWSEHEGTGYYDKVSEIAIGLIIAAGWGPDDVDNAGDRVGDNLQSALMDAMFRSGDLTEMFDLFECIVSKTIVNNGGKLDS